MRPALSILALPLLVVANVVPRDQCSHTLLCCNALNRADSEPTATLLGLLGVVVPGSTLIGVSCTPITVIGPGGSSCAGQTVCCANNNFNGLIAVDCHSIII